MMRFVLLGYHSQLWPSDRVWFVNLFNKDIENWNSGGGFAVRDSHFYVISSI